MKNNLNLFALIALLHVSAIFSLENNNVNISFEKSLETAVEKKINEELEQLQQIEPQEMNLLIRKVPEIKTIREDAKKAFENTLNSDEFKTETILKHFKEDMSDPNLAAKINSELEKVYGQAQKAQPYTKDLKFGLKKIKSEYAALSTRMVIPRSINDFVISVVDFAQKTINSKDALDINVINSLQGLFSAIIDTINKLYAHKDNISNAITAAGIDKLKLLVKNSFNALYDFAGNHNDELNALIKKASLIEPQDAIKFEKDLKDHYIKIDQQTKVITIK